MILYYISQLMGSGVPGLTGATVPLLVLEVYRIDPELVQTLHLRAVVTTVPDQDKIVNDVTLSIVQVIKYNQTHFAQI